MMFLGKNMSNLKTCPCKQKQLKFKIIEMIVDLDTNESELDYKLRSFMKAHDIEH